MIKKGDQKRMKAQKIIPNTDVAFCSNWMAQWRWDWFSVNELPETKVFLLALIRKLIHVKLHWFCLRLIVEFSLTIANSCMHKPERKENFHLLCIHKLKILFLYMAEVLLLHIYWAQDRYTPIRLWHTRIYEGEPWGNVYYEWILHTNSQYLLKLFSFL